MTANGAEGETRAQMENVLGMTVSELNDLFALYLNALPQSDDAKISLANSIWLRDCENFAVKEAFLQTNADVYGAGAYRAPFDGSTVRDVNRWVKDKTDGMIEKIVDRFAPDDVILLVNALAFDAKWDQPYTQSSQRPSGVFHLEDGTETKATFLYDKEHLYLTDADRAVGFVKPYVGGRYAFAALLPNEGIPVGEYLATLDGETVSAILKNAQEILVDTKLPKFETAYETVLNNVLAGMGMIDAFDPAAADFSGITESYDTLYIGEVRHKTFIEVGEKGTRAAAVTSVGAKNGGVPAEVPPVILDRPFVYLIYDTVTRMPIFIGVLNDPS